jgi:hypothetical protein
MSRMMCIISVRTRADGHDQTLSGGHTASRQVLYRGLSLLDCEAFNEGELVMICIAV